MGGPNAAAEWARLSSAYDILSDKEMLRQWEAQREAQRSSQAGVRHRGSSQRSRGSWKWDTKWNSQEPSAWGGFTWKEPIWEEDEDRAKDKDPDDILAGAALRTVVASAAAAGCIAEQVVGIAGKFSRAASPEISSKAAGISGTAAAVAGQLAISVLDSASPRAARIAKMQLRELLVFLSQATEEQETSSAAASTAAPATGADVQTAEKYARWLLSRIERFTAEQQRWARRAQACQASGDIVGELSAWQRAFEARDKAENATSVLLQCHGRMDEQRKR